MSQINLLKIDPFVLVMILFAFALAIATTYAFIQMDEDQKERIAEIEAESCSRLESLITLNLASPYEKIEFKDRCLT
jgi:hypothetical protein